ncbi:MAG: class I SAM-dependent methyltransferase [Gaiellaceae bacterium]
MSEAKPLALLRRALGGRGGRLLRGSLARAGLYTYRPSREYEPRLRELSEYVVDARQVRDKRPTTIESVAGRREDLTITTEGLEDILGKDRFRGARILEVGPKWGIHSLWIDTALEPSELVFCDFAADKPLHDEWVGRLTHPHRFVYGDLRTAYELLELDPFDLVLFCGVLYHTVHHPPMLSLLNRATCMGGRMLLETSYDPRPDSLVNLRWHDRTGKAKAVPTLDALRIMLTWTGWRKITRFGDYRPDSSEAIFLCEKTDELSEETDFASVVRPHRAPA